MSGTGARGAFLLAVALILGIVLLQEFDTGTVPFSQQVDTGVTSTTRRGASVSVVPTPTTRATRPPDQVKVVAANGTNTTGLGAKTTEFLRQSSYNVLAPTDATKVVESSQVQHKPEFEAEARAVAQLLGLPVSAVKTMEAEPPVPDTRDADVLVIIGPDLRLPGDTTTSTRRA